MKNVLTGSPAVDAGRRSFVKKLGLAGLAGAVVAGNLRANDPPPITDADILQFALNLEYLEAEFYTVATTGKRISDFGIGTDGSGVAGATTGGAQVTFDRSFIYTSAIAQQIADDERSHVTYLRNALTAAGVTPIAKPAINLDALGIGYANMREFLTVARALEDTGVTAYGGAAPLIQDKGILGAAARILATEAQHSGNIRLQIAHLLIKTTALDGVDVLPPPSGSDFIATDSDALSQVRTPGQVLYIAFGAANVTMGGFFPAGVNGNINMSSDPA